MDVVSGGQPDVFPHLVKGDAIADGDARAADVEVDLLQAPDVIQDVDPAIHQAAVVPPGRDVDLIDHVPILVRYAVQPEAVIAERARRQGRNATHDLRVVDVGGEGLGGGIVVVQLGGHGGGERQDALVEATRRGEAYLVMRLQEEGFIREGLEFDVAPIDVHGADAGQFAGLDGSLDVDVGRVATHHVAVLRRVGDGAAHDGIGGVFGAGADDDFTERISHLSQLDAQAILRGVARNGEGHHDLLIT